MRQGGGKAKGSQFEREVCTNLSRWVSAGKQDDVFWRSALSGGRSTVAFKKGKRLANQVGDISCIHPVGNHFISAFACECKAYADLDFKGLITGKGKLIQFWDEIKSQASRYQKNPILIARQNRMPMVVCLSSQGMVTLRLSTKDTLLVSNPQDLWILNANHFFTTCQPYVG